MTDLEISKALALAIGWKQTYTVDRGEGIKVTICITPDGHFPEEWRFFDYLDWNVIGPIAERYNAFPYIDPCTDKWEGYVARLGIDKARVVWADTPQKAIALAVIGAKK